MGAFDSYLINLKRFYLSSMHENPYAKSPLCHSARIHHFETVDLTHQLVDQTTLNNWPYYRHHDHHTTALKPDNPLGENSTGNG